MLSLRTGARLPAILGLGLALGFAVPVAVAQQPFSDNFSGKTLNPGWTVSSPNPDSSVGLTGNGYLNLTASPLNGGSDLYADSNYNAPVILQPVAGDTNWTITTQINFSPTNNYQGAGILLATQPGGFTDPSQFSRIMEYAFNVNNGGDVVEYPAGYAPYTAGTIYFRLTKKGSAKKGWSYTGAYSANGKSWTPGGSVSVATPYTYIGLFCIRQPWDYNDSVYSVADFNDFKVKVKP